MVAFRLWIGGSARAVALAAAIATSACVTMPRERAEAPPLPSQWRDAPAGATLPVTDWWQGFDDPALTQLVDRAKVAQTIAVLGSLYATGIVDL